MPGGEGSSKGNPDVRGCLFVLPCVVLLCAGALHGLAVRFVTHRTAKEGINSNNHDRGGRLCRGQLLDLLALSFLFSFRLDDLGSHSRDMAARDRSYMWKASRKVENVCSCGEA